MADVIPSTFCSSTSSDGSTVEDSVPPQKRVRHLREDLHVLTSTHNSENNETIGISVNNSSANATKSVPAAGSATKITDNFRPVDIVLDFGKEQCRQDLSLRTPSNVISNGRKRGRGRGRKRGRPPGRGRKRIQASQAALTQTSSASLLRYEGSPYSPASWVGRCTPGGRVHRVRPLDHERKLRVLINKEEPDLSALKLSPTNTPSPAPKPMALNTPSWRITTPKLSSDIDITNHTDGSTPTQPDVPLVKVGRPKAKKRGRPKGKSKRSTKSLRGWKRPPRYIQCSTVLRGTDYDIDSDVSMCGVWRLM